MTNSGNISRILPQPNPQVMRLFGIIRTASVACCMAILLAAVAAAPAHAQVFTAPTNEPDRFRGQIIEVADDSIVLQTKNGPVRLGTPSNLSIFSLTKTTFADVDFGSYVGAVSVKLNEFSPIIRDSMSYLHRGFELRIMDESLRGIALGHTKWDLTSDSVMSHGWVDDLEIRVLSIKYGPTEEEEADVDIPRGAPVLRMALGSKALIQPGAHVFAGASNGQAVFLMIGEAGVAPPM